MTSWYTSLVTVINLIRFAEAVSDAAGGGRGRRVAGAHRSRRYDHHPPPQDYTTETSELIDKIT